MVINIYAPKKDKLDEVELSTDGDVDEYYILPRVGENIVANSDRGRFYLKVLAVIHYTGKELGFIDIECEQFENYDDMMEDI